jgi:hypothetical protein
MRRHSDTAGALVLAVGLILFGPLPAAAHTRAELDRWTQEWEIRAVPGVTAAELAELADMSDRHPWYFNPQPAAQTTAGFATGPAPAPAPVSGGNVERWRELVSAYFPAGDVDRALCLMDHESGGDPDALNPTSSAAGLFQVMPFWWDHYGGDRFNPETNVRVAALIKADQGWTAWSPYNRGECR